MIAITIAGKPGEGKTTTAKLIHDALASRGADVAITDGEPLSEQDYSQMEARFEKIPVPDSFSGRVYEITTIPIKRSGTGVINDDVIASEHIMQFFDYEHLAPHLQVISRPFFEHAKVIIQTIPRNAERSVALRKLLESKDATVRAYIAK